MAFQSNKKTPTAVTQLTGGTPSTVWFADANGIVQELPIGAAGTVLTAGVSGANPSWTTPAGGGGSGEVNTASNVGTGSGIFKQKTGVNLELRTLKAGSTKLSVTASADEIALDVVQANLAAMTGATGVAAGTKGEVPAPAAGDQGKFLCGNGTWATPASGGGGDPVILYGTLFQDSVAAHVHRFSLTAAQMATLVSTGSLTTTSETSSGHTHTVSINYSAANRFQVSSSIDSGHLHQGGMNTVANDFGGASSSSNGSPGYVPKPFIGDQTLFLRGDGQWAAAGGASAHSSLSGLTTGDDHTQYLNNTRGDARYSVLAHVHTFASLTSKPTTISGYGITDFNSLGDVRWAPVSHNHDASYATVGHLHGGVYSPVGHDHAGVYSPVAHNHDVTYAPIGHDHAGVYAPVAHSHPAFTGDTGTGGVKGEVPAPAAGDASLGKYLKADGTWATLPLVGSNAVNPDDATVIIAIQMFT